VQPLRRRRRVFRPCQEAFAAHPTEVFRTARSRNSPHSRVVSALQTRPATCLSVPKRHRIPIAAASAANASGFLQVSLSKMPRPEFSSALQLPARRHFRSRLATYRQTGCERFESGGKPNPNRSYSELALRTAEAVRKAFAGKQPQRRLRGLTIVNQIVAEIEPFGFDLYHVLELFPIQPA